MSVINIRLDPAQFREWVATTNRLSTAIEKLVDPGDDPAALDQLTNELKTHQEGLSHAVEVATLPSDQPQL